MEKYLGVKIIHAEPMSSPEATAQRLHTNSKVEDGYKVVYEDGYESWSPKEVFEKAYRRIDNLTFGLAVEALKLGKKVSRSGWNGKGMWLKLVPQTMNHQGSDDMGDAIYFDDELPKDIFIKPWIGMKTVNDEFVPWLASQTDILAEDWQIIE